jgi:molecular chaperone GrpE (heat shock protein)
MVNQNSTKRLISFVDNLEEKLLSVNKIHDQLYQLMSIVSSTHQTILEDLTRIKGILNERRIEQEDDQLGFSLFSFF